MRIKYGMIKIISFFKLSPSSLEMGFSFKFIALTCSSIFLIYYKLVIRFDLISKYDKEGMYGNGRRNFEILLLVKSSLTRLGTFSMPRMSKPDYSSLLQIYNYLIFFIFAIPFNLVSLCLLISRISKLL
jgi:hypothetical protein